MARSSRNSGAEKSEVEQQVDDAALWERVRLVDQYVPEKAHAPRGFESVVEVHMTKQLVPPQYPNGESPYYPAGWGERVELYDEAPEAALEHANL